MFEKYFDKIPSKWIHARNLEKIDGDNFCQLTCQIKCAPKAKGYFETKATRRLYRHIKKSKGIAMFIVTSSIDFKQITLIENCKTAVEMMSKLESIYEQKRELYKMLFYEKNVGTKYHELIV